MSDYIFRGNYTTRLRKGLREGNVVYFGKRLVNILEENGIHEVFLKKVRHKRLLENEPYYKKFRSVKILTSAPDGRGHAKVKIKKGSIKVPQKMVRYADLMRGKYCILGDGKNLQLWNDGEYIKSFGPNLGKKGI